MSDLSELLDAAHEYSIANDRYHAACHRLDIARNKQNVPSEEWDDVTRAACTAVNDAQDKLTNLCSRLFPQTEREAVWKEYSEHFWPAREPESQVDEVARSEALDRERGAGR